MGLQHYKIYLVPTEFQGDLELREHWSNRQPEKELLDLYCRVLPLDTSWGDVSEFRTNESFGSVIYVWRVDKNVSTLELEWTPGEFDTLKVVCTLARRMNCSIWSRETGQVFEPVVENCLSDWKRTKSARFAENPSETLVTSARELDENEKRSRNRS